MSNATQNQVNSELERFLKENPLVLRILSGPYQGERIEIATAKCKLRGTEQDSAQCAIYRTLDDVSIEDLAGKAKLNGQPFQRSSLQLGARIDCGSLELQVEQMPTIHGFSHGTNEFETQSSSHQIAQSQPSPANSLPQQPLPATTGEETNQLHIELAKRLEMLEETLSNLQQASDHTDNTDNDKVDPAQLQLEMDVKIESVNDQLNQTGELVESFRQQISNLESRIQSIPTFDPEHIHGLSNTIEQLESVTINSLKAQIESVANSVSEKIANAESQSTTNSETEENLETLRSQINALQGEFSGFGSQLQELAQRSQASLAQHESQQHIMEELTNKVGDSHYDEFSARLEHLKNQVESLAENAPDLVDVQSKIAELENSRTESATKMDSLESSLNQSLDCLSKQLNGLQEDQIPQHQNSISQAIEHTDRLQNRVDRLDEIARTFNPSEWMDQMSTLRSRIEQCDSQLSGWNSQVQEQHGEALQQAKQETEFLKDKFDDLSTILERFQIEQNAIRENTAARFGELTSKVDHVSEKQDRIEQQTKNWEQQIHDSQSESNTRIDQIQGQIEQIPEIKQAVDAAAARLDELKSEAHNARELAELTAEKQRIADEQAQNWEQQIHDSRSESNTRIDQIQGQIEQIPEIKQSIENGTTQVTELKSDVQSVRDLAEQTATAQQNAWDELRSKIESLRSETSTEIAQQISTAQLQSQEDHAKLDVMHEEQMSLRESLQTELVSLSQQVGSHSNKFEEYQEQLSALVADFEKSQSEISKIQEYTESQQHHAVDSSNSKEESEFQNRLQNQVDELTTRMEQCSSKAEEIGENFAYNREMLQLLDK